MSIKLTIDGKEYVAILKEEYERKYDEYGTPILSEEEMTEEDWEDVAESQRRANEPEIPWEQVKAELGLK
jgi:hypothetical protein